MPTTPDFVLAVLIGVAHPLVDYFWIAPWLRRGLVSGARNARVAWYAEAIVAIGGLTLLVAASRLSRHLPWGDVGLVVPGGWRMAVAALLVAALAWFGWKQLRAIGRLTEERRRRVRAKLGEMDLLSPRTPGDRAWWVAVSITAGVGEELLFRGFLVWVLTPWLTVWGAAIVSLASFVSSHAYQGRDGIPRVAVTGALLALVALVTHSVVPSMVLHVMLDLISSESAYGLYRPEQGAVAAAAS